MTSIRRFLIIVLIATITLVNFLAALHGYQSSMTKADRLFDEQLINITGVLATTLDGATSSDTNNPKENSITYQIWKDGLLIAASGSLPPEPLTSLENGFNLINFGGYRWRTYTRHIPESDYWLIVAEREDIRFTLAENVIIESVLPIILGLPLICLLIWVVVSRGLTPLKDLANEMRTKRSEDLSPVSITKPPNELANLVGSINDLLARLDASFERERRLASDAAHELRTPISILKVELHNLLEEAEQYHPELEHLGLCVERMSRSVEQVLMLYRTSPDQFIANFKEVDLASIAREAIAELYTQLSRKNQAIELLADSALMQGDALTLKSLLTNLIGNASKYCGTGAQIRVTVSANHNTATLTVEDDGPGIPAAERDRVFKRFYRGAAGHTDIPADGSGIGLAIVQHIADIHNATIRLGESDFSSGLAVVVTFPVTQQSLAPEVTA